MLERAEQPRASSGSNIRHTPLQSPLWPAADRRRRFAGYGGSPWTVRHGGWRARSGRRRVAVQWIEAGPNSSH